MEEQRKRLRELAATERRAREVASRTPVERARAFVDEVIAPGLRMAADVIEEEMGTVGRSVMVETRTEPDGVRVGRLMVSRHRGRGGNEFVLEVAARAAGSRLVLYPWCAPAPGANASLSGEAQAVPIQRGGQPAADVTAEQVAIYAMDRYAGYVEMLGTTGNG